MKPQPIKNLLSEFLKGKDFKAINMGVMEMKTGNGELTLRALKIPGQEALEFRLLMLLRVPPR